MLEYVEKVKGSTLLLIVRSEKHPRGATKISDPLNRKIKSFGNRVAVKRYPEQ
jgi:hypothetical protein